MGAQFATPLLYAQVWEDEQVLREALRLSSSDDVLSIASAGDNAFALLLDSPRTVTLLDRNETQLALVHLKMAAIQHLDPADARLFLGAEPASSARRVALYRSIRYALAPRWQTIWDNSSNAIEAGVLNVGKFERYLSTFRRLVLPLVQSRGTVSAMMALRDLGEQQRLYNARWDSWRWRTLFRLFFGRKVMSRMGREAAFFDHVTQRSIGDVFRLRAEKALTLMPAADNRYLDWILTGKSSPPPYLIDDNYLLIRQRLDRLRFVEEDLTTHLQASERGTYSAYNLSDCFEYLSKEASDGCLSQIARTSPLGSRLCYWNLLVARDGEDVPGIASNHELAQVLHAKDRAFFYGRLIIEEVENASLS